MTKNYEIKIFELGIDTKKPVYNFKGTLKCFNIEKFKKSLNAITDKNYMLRSCIAAFCYGVYVRLLF